MRELQCEKVTKIGPCTSDTDSTYQNVFKNFYQCAPGSKSTASSSPTSPSGSSSSSDPAPGSVMEAYNNGTLSTMTPPAASGAPPKAAEIVSSPSKPGANHDVSGATAAPLGTKVAETKPSDDGARGMRGGPTTFGEGNFAPIGDSPNATATVREEGANQLSWTDGTGKHFGAGPGCSAANRAACREYQNLDGRVDANGNPATISAQDFNDGKWKNKDGKGPVKLGDATEAGQPGPATATPEMSKAQARADARANAGESRVRESTSGGDTECAVSSGINGKYGCDATYSTVEAAKITNVVTQTVGSAAVGVMGQMQQTQAMQQGTQSSAYHAAATTQRTSGTIQLSTGGLNVGLGAIQMVQAFGHKKDAGKFNSAKGGGLNTTGGEGNEIQSTGMAQEIISGASLNQKSGVEVRQDARVRQADLDLKKGRVADGLAFNASKAAGEQQRAAKMALAGGMQSIISGAAQITNGTFNIIAAGQLDDIANKMKNIEGLQAQGTSFVPLAPGQVQPADALAPRAPNSINPTAVAENAAAVDDTAKAPVAGDLGTPIGGPAPTGLKEAGPTAGKFTSKDTPLNGGGGAGGGLGGGGSTSAANGDQGEGQAKAADGKGGGVYEGSGALGAVGGGGGGGGKDPDLSGLLAQFLPKKEDADKNQNGIMDFGGRAPASDGPISLLDKNVNIFERIHQTYQDKHRRNNVGI